MIIISCGTLRSEKQLELSGHYVHKRFQFNQLTCCYNEVENWWWHPSVSFKILRNNSNSPKNAKMIKTSLHRLENEMFNGSKNWSPTANWQYRQSEVLKGLSRYPPNTFTKSCAQAEQVWFAGGLNTANSSGWHLITRPLGGFSWAYRRQ